MRRTALVLGFAGLVCAAPEAQQPVFRSGVQYVAVDVVVTDRNDKPILDLKSDDFSITENGKPQKVDDFQFVSVPAVTRAIEATTKAQPEPDVATNVAPSPNSRLFVIVIDDLHLIEQDIVRIKTVLRDLVQNFSPDDEVALTFVSFSNLSVNFTRNHSRILAAIDNVKAGLGFGFDSLGGGKQTGSYARSSAATLKNVTRSLGGSSHPRRAIFFISAGTTADIWAPMLPPEIQAVRDDTLETFDLARRADVPIYAIDPRGNVAPEDAIRGGISRIPTPGVRLSIAANLRTQRNNLSELSVNTGGRAIVGASDMKRMMQEVVQENSSFYLLGYYPEPPVSDGKFHELQVTVNRPGAIVRARKGYVAPASARANVATASVLETAMSAGVNVSGLPIRVFAAPIAATAKGMTTAVTVEVTYPAPIDGSRRIDDNIELSLVALDPDAKVKLRANRPMRFSGNVSGTDAITFLVDEVIELPAQALTLRVGMASEALGVAGTSQVAIDGLKVADSKLQMSGVVVGLDGPPREAVMNGSLFAPLMLFQPTTARVFTSSDTLKLFARMFWKGKDSPAVTLTISRMAPGPEGPGLQTTASITTSAAEGGRQEAVLDTTVPLKSLAPGRYHLSVDARLSNGQSAGRVILFEVK